MANKQIIDFPPVSVVASNNVFHVHTGVNNRISAEDLFTAIADDILIPATTSDAGIVQLTDSVSSTSTTTAATPNSVKQAYDLADSKVGITTSVIAGDGVTGGGTLSGDVTITLGTPETLSISSTNNVTASGHTHQVTFPVTSVSGKTGDVTVEAADVDGLAAVASSGSFSDLVDAPSIGTVAGRDVVTGSGDTTVSRIPDVAWVQANAGGGSSTWQYITTDVMALSNRKYIVVPTATEIEVTLPSSMNVGDFVSVKCSPKATNTLKIINNDYTIVSRVQTISSGDNIILSKGQYVQLACSVSGTELEVISG